jgi:dipeptide/tripeptide permease
MTYGATPAKDRVLGNAVYLMGFDLGSLIGPLISVPVVIFFGIPSALAVAALAPATALVILRMSAKKRA